MEIRGRWQEILQISNQFVYLINQRLKQNEWTVSHYPHYMHAGTASRSTGLWQATANLRRLHSTRPVLISPGRLVMSVDRRIDVFTNIAGPNAFRSVGVKLFARERASATLFADVHASLLDRSLI